MIQKIDCLPSFPSSQFFCFFILRVCISWLAQMMLRLGNFKLKKNRYQASWYFVAKNTCDRLYLWGLAVISYCMAHRLWLRMMCPHRHSGLNKAPWCYFCRINWGDVLNVVPPNPRFILYSPARGIFRSHQHDMVLEPNSRVASSLPKHSCRDEWTRSSLSEKPDAAFLHVRYLLVSSWYDSVLSGSAQQHHPCLIAIIILNLLLGSLKRQTKQENKGRAILPPTG